MTNSARSAASRRASKQARSSRETLVTASPAESAEDPSSSIPRETSLSPERVDLLIAATEPLLALFAVCDDVFTEEDALSQDHIRKTVGRVYEEWKRTRRHFDPDFHMEDHLRPRRVRNRGIRPERL